MKKVQERMVRKTQTVAPTVRKTLTVEPTVRETLTVASSTSRIHGQLLIGLVAALVVMSVVVLSGQELKHVPPAAPNLTVLHSFIPGDGVNPIAGLIQDAAGNLYGTTAFGGAACAELSSQGCGVVFELIRCNSGYDFKVLHKFTGGADGAAPSGGLIRDAAGNLYGTTFYGGGSSACGLANGTPSGCGTVFKLSPTSTKTVLHTFTSGDGQNPSAGLIREAAGNFYGTTTYGGGAGGGVVFELSPTGIQTVLYSFAGGADGAFPLAGLIRDVGGNLYGTTQSGGTSSGCAPFGCGVVFKLSPTGTETVLHSFTGRDGAFPSAGLIQDTVGNLYGTTEIGGAYGFGVVFKLSPTGNRDGAL